MVKGLGDDPEAVERAIAVAKEKLCPVWNMLKKSVPITAEFRVDGE